MCKEFLTKNKELIHIGASITTIIALIFAMITINYQIDKQHEEELNSLISDLEGLDFEVSKNLEFVEILINQKEEIINGFIFNEFIFENFRKELTDGRINNQQLKHVIFAKYFMLKEFDNALKNMNSASFYLTSPDDYKVRKRIQYNRFATALNNTVKPEFIKLRFDLNSYITCLKDQKDITKIDVCSKTPAVE